jgi:hypothetical protein
VGKFHTKQGLWFERTPEDGVLVTKTDVQGNNPEMAVTLTADEWASVVAHVSAYGEDRLSWETARKFHAGEFIIKG